MSSAARSLPTVEEYARLPNPDDGTKDELIDGAVVKRPLCATRRMLRECGAMLAEYADRHGGVAVIGSGVTVGREPDSVLGHDAAYWSTRQPDLDRGPDYPPTALFESRRAI